MMQPQQPTDPAVRYGAIGVLMAGTLALLAIIVHGYWLDPHYEVPTLIATLLSTAFTVAITLLGFNQGAHVTITGFHESQNGKSSQGGTTP